MQTTALLSSCRADMSAHCLKHSLCSSFFLTLDDAFVSPLHLRLAKFFYLRYGNVSNYKSAHLVCVWRIHSKQTLRLRAIREFMFGMHREVLPVKQK